MHRFPPAPVHVLALALVLAVPLAPAALAQSTANLAGGAALTATAGGTAGPGSDEAQSLSGHLGSQSSRLGEATSLQGGGSTVRGGQQSLSPVQQAPRADLGPLPPLATTQFQRFVQESTGAVLPLHGFRLFDRPRFPSVADGPVPANYAVGPGDELDIKLWGSVDLTARLPVDRQGQITVPRVGPISVAGLRASELDAHLRKQLAKVYANFELSATVGKIRSIQVFVVGQARSPGVHTVSSLSTLVSALFEAGGPAATGSMRRIDLMRAGTKVTTLDLYRLIQAGDTSGDTRLLPGDVIVVQPAGPRVALTGALDNAAVYELANSQETVGQLLGYSGASTALVKPQRALLERVNAQQAIGPREVNELTLDAAGLQRPLRDGDVVTLQRISAEFANAVTLRGNVASPLRYPFKPGMRVADLIPEVDALIEEGYHLRKNILVQYEGRSSPSIEPSASPNGVLPGREAVAAMEAQGVQARLEQLDRRRNLTNDRVLKDMRDRLPQVNWEYASIERMNRGEVTTQLVPFNLGRAVRARDPAHNLELQPGDVVNIYNTVDLPLPRERLSQFVQLSGEVNVPGVYQINPGETLADIVQRAGGFSKSAYVFGTVFTRETTRAQQQANLEQAIRRFEAAAGSQAAATVQNASSPEAQQALQLQLASQRASLERLRSLRASGRVALEMDPQRPQLPGVLLEDGDSISVPFRPSFVAIFGSVGAETSFIYRPGATVRDYLDRAGPTREADLDSAMLIRSDGTVLVNAAGRSAWGWGDRNFMATAVNPGDTVFVPEKLDRRTALTQFMTGAKDWSQIFYQFGLGASAIRVLRNN